MTRLHVPDAAAGERLDVFLAGLPEIGSRAVAERLLGTAGVLVDGRAAAEELPARGRGGGRVRAAGRADVGARPAGDGSRDPVRGRASARRRQARGARRASRTGALERHARPRPARARRRGRRRAGAPRHRAPARPRHVGLARRRALAGGAPAAAGDGEGARGDARVPRARRRPPALAARPDRSADRARPARRAAPLPRHRHAARCGHALRGRRAAATTCAAARHPRDRADASDPCASRRDRPAGRGRPGLRATRRARPRAAVPARRPACVHASRSPERRSTSSSPLPGDLAGALERART